MSVVGNWSGRLVNPAALACDGFRLAAASSRLAPGHIQGAADLGALHQALELGRVRLLAGLVPRKPLEDLLERLILAIERSADRAQLFEPLVLTRPEVRATIFMTMLR